MWLGSNAVDLGILVKGHTTSVLYDGRQGLIQHMIICIVQ